MLRPKLVLRFIGLAQSEYITGTRPLWDHNLTVMISFEVVQLALCPPKDIWEVRFDDRRLRQTFLTSAKLKHDCGDLIANGASLRIIFESLLPSLLGLVKRRLLQKRSSNNNRRRRIGFRLLW